MLVSDHFISLFFSFLSFVLESGKSRSDDYDEGSSDVLDGYFENNKSRKTKRLRSSNRFVDRWLSDEEGNDAFADLEGFIVE